MLVCKEPWTLLHDCAQDVPASQKCKSCQTIAYESYEGFYTNGAVKLPGEDDIKSVKDIVVENESLYEPIGEDVDNALNHLRENGPVEDAWAQIAPQSEQVRIESLEECKNHNSDEEDSIPELYADSHS